MKRLASGVIRAQGNRFVKELLRGRVTIGSNKDEFEANLNAAIEHGLLTMDHVEEWIQSVEGWGNQHIYLYNLSAALKKELTEEKVLARVKAARLAKFWNANITMEFPEEPELTSISFRDGVLRLVWQEASPGWSPEPEKNFTRQEGLDFYEYRAWRRVERRAITRFEARVKDGLAGLFIPDPIRESEHQSAREEAMHVIAHLLDLQALERGMLQVAQVSKNLDQRNIPQNNGAAATVKAQKSRLSSGGAYVEFAANSSGKAYWEEQAVQDVRKSVRTEQLNSFQGEGVFQFGEGAAGLNRSLRVQLYGDQNRIRLWAHECVRSVGNPVPLERAPMSAGALSPLPGKNTIRSRPSQAYWDSLVASLPHSQLDALRLRFDQGWTEFKVAALPPPLDQASAVLERVAADGWLKPTGRFKCGASGEDLTEAEALGVACPYCHASLTEFPVVHETVFVNDVPPRRSVDWVIAVHGMNTTGTWQEAFGWTIGTTWGRSVPVAVYKYGTVIAGVILAWRRRKLQHDLRAKIATLREQAVKGGYDGRPDLIAHSFGTWLIGHLLRDELTVPEEQRLRFGRVVLAGCILRPDYDWEALQNARIVEEVLNHYGTADMVVPWAHFTIWDSGPSGRRGFDNPPPRVLNIRAEGFGHSDLLSAGKRVDGKPALNYSYERYWRPFLTLSREEVRDLPDRADPAERWRPFPWILQGTMFPIFALPLVATVILLLAAFFGKSLWKWSAPLFTLGKASSCGLIAIIALAFSTLLWRAIFKSRSGG